MLKPRRILPREEKAEVRKKTLKVKRKVLTEDV
jgi:hypothetical protein